MSIQSTVGNIKVSNHGKNNINYEDSSIVINRIVDKLTPVVDTFDAIVISGYSMATIGSVVAHLLKKNIIIVRKPTEKCYSKHAVEGKDGQRYIFLDDFMETGSTFLRCMKAINENLNDCACVAVGSYYARLTPSGVNFCKNNVNDSVAIYDLT